MQDYFKELPQVKTPKQLADEAYREAQIDYVKRNRLYEELAELRKKNGNSPELDQVQRVLDILTRRHGD
jgi:hypothetical protein